VYFSFYSVHCKCSKFMTKNGDNCDIKLHPGSQKLNQKSSSEFFLVSD
jgi:hypothetical protein